MTDVDPAKTLTLWLTPTEGERYLELTCPGGPCGPETPATSSGTMHACGCARLRPEDLRDRMVRAGAGAVRVRVSRGLFLCRLISTAEA